MTFARRPAPFSPQTFWQVPPQSSAEARPETALPVELRVAGAVGPQGSSTRRAGGRALRRAQVGSRLWSSLGLAVLLGAGVVSCGAAQEKRLADGSWHIQCGESMNRCTTRADVLCGDRGYEVLGGSTRSKMLGGATGYRARVGVAELIVRCGDAEPVAEPEEAPQEERVVESPSPRPAGVCIPGATQACVGPGGCQGGQACVSDGSGFGPCDCGPASATQSAPPAGGAAEPSANAVEHVDDEPVR